MSYTRSLEAELELSRQANRSALHEALKWRKYAEQLERMLLRAQGRQMTFAQELRQGVRDARREAGLSTEAITTETGGT